MIRVLAGIALALVLLVWLPIKVGQFIAYGTGDPKDE